MIKKIVLVGTLLIFLFGVYASLQALDACKAVFSTCTEGGCGQLDNADNCTMICMTKAIVNCGEVAVE